MPRSFSPLGLVTLPRLSSAAAMALGVSLLSAAEGRGELPASVARSTGRLATTLGALRRARQHEGKPTGVDTKRAFAADRQLDAAWGALHSFLRGWARLPASSAVDAQRERARRLLALVFAEGLKFTQAPFVTQWAESQMRIDRLGGQAAGEALRALGGETFLAVLREAHDAYGAALNVTEPRAEAKPPPRLREPLAEFVAALRRHVLLVRAHVEANEGAPEARALADALLEPLRAWRSPGGARKAKGADDEAPPGAEGADDGAPPGADRAGAGGARLSG